MTSAFSTFHVNECFGSHNGFNHFLNSHLILCEIFLACTFTVDHIFNHDFFFLGHLGSSEQYNLKDGILHILKYDSINILIQCSSRHYWATWTAATNKTIWKLECVTFFEKTNCTYLRNEERQAMRLLLRLLVRSTKPDKLGSKIFSYRI